MARGAGTAPFDMARKRSREIAALVLHRHGQLPDTDDRDIYLEAAAWHLKPRDGDLAFALDQWSRRVGAMLPIAEINRIVESVSAKPRRFKADTLARMLRVTHVERTRLKLTTIGCYDVSKAERTRLRKERHRRGQQARRRARGVIMRAQYLATSISRQQPWWPQDVSSSNLVPPACPGSGTLRQVRAQHTSLNAKHGPVSRKRAAEE